MFFKLTYGKPFHQFISTPYAANLMNDDPICSGSNFFVGLSEFTTYDKLSFLVYSVISGIDIQVNDFATFAYFRFNIF